MSGTQRARAVIGQAERMTRTLVILRHAKAARPAGVADLDRPLTERGHADAAAAGAWLASRGYAPDLVLCSPSKRTRQTWHGVAVALSGSRAPEVRYERVLYDDGIGQVLKLLHTVPDEVRTVLLIGHNPNVSMLSAVLDRSAARDSDGLRTSGIAVHTLDGSWSEYAAGAAPLVTGGTARA
jgi:phosphohistidine phosphatase